MKIKTKHMYLEDLLREHVDFMSGKKGGLILPEAVLVTCRCWVSQLASPEARTEQQHA